MKIDQKAQDEIDKTLMPNIKGPAYNPKEGVEEAAKPDFLDVDKDGDKKEPFKKAVKDKEAKKEKTEESIKADLRWMQAVAGIVVK